MANDEKNRNRCLNLNLETRASHLPSGFYIDPIRSLCPMAALTRGSIWSEAATPSSPSLHKISQQPAASLLAVTHTGVSNTALNLPTEAVLLIKYT